MSYKSSKARESLFFLLMLCISLLVRFPRENGIIGKDTYFLMKEATLLVNGNLQTLIHPLSLLGVYPFSTYPIGSLLAFGFFYIIAQRGYIAATWLYMITFILVGLITSKKLFSYIFKENRFSYFLSLIYINMPYITLFSYFNSTARLPFYSLMPIFYLCLLKYIKEEKKKDLLFMFISMIILFFFHRMAMALALSTYVIGLIFILKILKFYGNKHNSIKKLLYLSNKHFEIIYFAICLFLISINYILKDMFDLFIRDSLFFDPKNGLIEYYGTIIVSNLVGRVGPIIIFSMMGLIIAYRKKKKMYDIDYKSIKYLLLISIPFFVFIQSVYVGYMLVVPSIAIAGITFYFLLKEKWVAIAASLAFSSFFIIGYIILHFLAINIGNYVYIAPLIGVILLVITYLSLDFQRNILKKYRLYYKRILLPFILSLLLFHTFFIIDLNNKFLPQNQDSPSGVFSEEEKLLSQFLNENNNGTFDAYSLKLGARIALYSNKYQLSDMHSVSLVQAGIYSISQITKSTVIKPIIYWYQLTIFNSSLHDSMWFHSNLLLNNATSNESISIIKQTFLMHFITRRNSTFAEVYAGYFVDSDFVKTLPLIAEVVFETENYLIWKINVS
ncbi:MAG: hypothetical protein ACTSP3_00835 [Candidatus Heimdallarchaeaceae archaeon]